jgi:flagellar hook assembly protein FlgD
VDFVRGLAHVIPASSPSAVRAIGSARRIRLEATSSAPEVAFKIGSLPTGRPEPVSSGLATSSFASWGYGNGSHTLYAYDCTAYGECSSSPTATTFTVDNSASTIASPAAGTAVTGLFTVRADNPARGPLRLLIGGRERGRVGTAPYEFQVSASALADGSHALTTQGCSIDGRHCSGPVSPPVVITTASLHPAIRSASPSPFSPNGDRVRDTTTLTFALPDTETVQVKVVNSARTTVRSRSLGTLHAGTHVWVWHGRANTGARVADGTYGVVLQTARGNLRGWISRSVVVDTKAPSLTRPSGANALFYPTPDGYRDVFTTHTKLGGPGRLTLAVRNAKRAQVRTIAVQRAAGSATISWQGHRASGGRVPAGTYYWTLSLTDAAGNVRRTGTYPVRVSAKRLVHETVHIGKPGAAYDDAAGTASCAHARRHDSAFLHGVRMVNTCSAQDFDLAFVQYTFTVPRAMSYGQVAIQVYGKSTHVPSELSAAFVANDGTLEIARYLKVGRTGNRWHTISSAPGTNHIAASRHVHATIVLDSYYPGMNDFDIDRARLRVGLVVLK